MTTTLTPRLKVTRWGADADEVARTQFVEGDGTQGGLIDQLEKLVAIDVQGLLSARPAAGTRGRLYTATDTGVMYRDDGVQWRVVGSRAVNAVINPAVAGDVALTVQGLSGQSGALQAWLNNAGDVLASIAADGGLTAAKVLATGTAGGPALRAVGTAAGSVVAQVQGAAGQTSALQQWLNSGGAVIGQLSAAGALTLSGGVTAGGAVRGTSLVSDGAVTAAAGVAGTTGRFSQDVAAPNLTGSPTGTVAPHSYLEQTVAQNVQGGGVWEAVIGLSAGGQGGTMVGSWSYGSGRWTVPVSGRYSIKARAGYAALANGRRFLRITVGGNTVDFDSTPSSGGQDFVRCEAEIFLPAGAVIGVDLANTAGPTAQTLIGGTTRVSIAFRGTA